MVREVLASFQPRVISDESLLHAAVLMPIVETDAGLILLLTRRTEIVRYHKGQVSFPGGARDGDEPLQVTALRETAEEIGILPNQVEILGQFHQYVSSSKYRVTPFVAVVSPGFQLLPNPAEVAYVLQVPLRFFLENQPECRTLERMGQKVSVYFYEYRKEVIWGLTASIVKEFVESLQLRS